METSARDVAEYVLSKLGRIPCMKLQKLVYYCQAWSLVWDDRPMFANRIEAWANGPVVRDLYAVHRLEYDVATVEGDAEKLDSAAKDTVDAVLKYYGDKSSQWLSDLTHQEDPWIEARGDLPPSARGTNEITLVALSEYYSAL